MRIAAILMALALVPWATALEVDVDPTGGPLVLIDQVAAVLADWRAAGADVDGTNRRVDVRYGDPELLGPDAIVLVVVRPDVGGYDVLVHPGLDGVRAALVPALGVVLGGVPGDGALNPRVNPVQAAVPDARDAAALRAARPEVAGDVDGDGRVDFEDLLRIAAAYGRQGINLPEDLDGDGVVGDGDLEVLRERYSFDTADDDPTLPAPAAGEGDGENADTPEPPVTPVTPDTTDTPKAPEPPDAPDTPAAPDAQN